MTRSRHLAAACGVLLLVSMYGLAQPHKQMTLPPRSC